MRHIQSARSQPQIPHPNCPKCGTPMWLARIEPDEPNYDRRTYECARVRSFNNRGREIQVRGTAVVQGVGFTTAPYGFTEPLSGRSSSASRTR